MENRSLLYPFLLMSLISCVMLLFLWLQANKSSVYAPKDYSSKYATLLGHSNGLVHQLHKPPLNDFPKKTITEQSNNSIQHSVHQVKHSVAQESLNPTQKQESSAHKVSHYTPTIPQHYWRNIDNSKDVQLKLFSAYFDSRFGSEVYLLGFENHKVQHPYYCTFKYEENVVCSKELAVRKMVNDDVDPYKDYDITLWGFYYVCKLPSSEIPLQASITLNQECKLNSEKDWLPVGNRENKENSQMAKFGVCVQGPVYNLKDPQIVVEYMELQRALGAEIITIYVQDAGPLVWKALQQYANEGLVDLINWNLTFVKDSGYYHYGGQSLLVNECLYRNMYRANYLALSDLDEVIVPQGRLHKWADMLPQIDANDRGAFLFSHTAFTGDVEEVKSDFLRCRPDTGTRLERIQPPRYLKKHKRFVMGGYEKFIVKPLSSRRISFHRIFGFINDYHMYKVPSEIGMSYHYRDPPLKTKGKPVLDTRLQNQFPQVLDKIRERLCSIYVDT